MRRILLAFLLAGCHGAAEPESTPTLTPTPAIVAVTLTKVRTGTIEATSSAVGTFFPRVQVVVSSKLSAPIAQMGLLRNQRVAQGQILAIQETRDLAGQRDEALAALQEALAATRALQGGTQPLADAQAGRDLADARSTEAAARLLYDRRNALYQKGGIALRDLEASRLAYVNAQHGFSLTRQTVKLRKSAIDPADLAVAEAKVHSAQERVRSLDNQIGYATLRAPISATVTEQVAFQGEFLAAGAKLVTLTDLSAIILKTPFPDEVAARLQIGDAVLVQPCDRPQESIRARVSAISPTSDPVSRSVEIWVMLHGNLRPGGSARMTVTTRRQNRAVLVDRQAVTFQSTAATSAKVMVVDGDSLAHERTILTGIVSASEVEVKKGLQPGDTVVKTGSFALPEGSKVTSSLSKAEP